MSDTIETREPRQNRGRFRHGIGLQTPRSQDSHCTVRRVGRRERGLKPGVRISRRGCSSGSMALPSKYDGGKADGSHFAGKAKDEARSGRVLRPDMRDFAAFILTVPGMKAFLWVRPA